MPLPLPATLFVLLALAAPIAPANPPDPQSAISNPQSKTPPPEWLKDVRWYMIDVPFFRNGEPSNDPSFNLPWGEQVYRGGTLTSDMQMSQFGRNLYGGDLLGLRQEIPYLKDLGVNAVILHSVFLPPRRFLSDTVVPWNRRFVHVAVSVGAPSFGPVGRTEPDPEDHTYTAGDRLFLEVVRDLHRAGLKVVIVLDNLLNFSPADPAPVEADLRVITKRWLTPRAEDLPPDGIDGFLVAQPQGDTAGFWTDWRKQMHAIKPDAALIATVVDSPKEWVHRGPFDAAFDLTQSAAIHRFFLEPHEPPDPGEPRAQGERNHAAEPPAPDDLRAEKFLADLTAAHQPAAFPNLSAFHLFREYQLGLDRDLRSAAIARRYPEPEELAELIAPPKRSTPSNADHIRLAYVFQAFAPGAPLLFQGEEVTFHIVEHLDHWLPMPWLDLPPPAVPPREYRGDLRALIRNLNLMRERYAPLRRGDFKPLLADDERKLLAFARTLPGDEVILVINHGAEKQRVSLPCAKPGQLVAVLTPQLRPLPVRTAPDQPPALPDPATVKDLRVGGSRQFADANGNVSFWVDPMGVRILLINDVEPRRDRP